MAGLYIHVPFCRQACTYCDFYFTTNLGGRTAFVDAVLIEAEARARSFPAKSFDTLYLGGGTPSLLDDDELRRLASGLRQHFAIAPEGEFTLECNPDDLDADKLATLREIGVNRLSIGTQSFVESHLQLMRRSHSAAQAQATIAAAQAAGFTNLTVDLIYGIPGLSEAEWRDNISRLIGAGVPHVSAYALTVEERTQLAFQIKRCEVSMPPDEEMFRQYEILIEMLNAAGIRQYELSNFARPGFESRHNSAYWTGAPYLGLGPSAHSYDGERRWWNVANHTFYAKHLTEGRLPVREEEHLSRENRINEYLMTHLRILTGVDPQWLRRELAFDLEAAEGEQLRAWIADGLMVRRDNGNYALTTRGLFVSDRIAGELFVV
jgi:oxygen-independent coproporphyrinogen-3 oxidase